MTVSDAYVLIADDEPIIATIVKRIVEQMGLIAVVVSDGAQAIQAARTLDVRFGCAIFDVMMPGMDGIAAAAAIHAFDAELPIIFMSGSEHLALFQRADTRSPVAFIQKPFRVEQLRSLLRQILQQKELEG